MVSTRRSKPKAAPTTSPQSIVTEGSSSSSDEESSASEQQAVTFENEDKNTSDDHQSPTTCGASRLFVPYRSLGILTSGAPYHLVEHQNSSNAMLVVPIGERFHMLQCDRLHPVLVSQAVGGESRGHLISHLTSDASMSISVVAHGTKGASSHVTLYSRTRPLQTVKVVPSKRWNVVDLMHLGKVQVEMKGEKEGSTENALVVAAVLAKEPDNVDDQDEHEGVVPIVGEDEQSESDSDDDDDEDSESEDENDDSNAIGQVVLLIATRDSIYIQRRMDLTETLQPFAALHPSTYLNKIIVGGKNGLVLINVRTTKLIHQFKCIKDDCITALEQSPVVDTVAIGTREGKVHLVNLRHDQRLFTLHHKSPITSLSFRTDSSAMRYGIAPLAVGRVDGSISIWDLTPNEESSGRTLLCEMDKVHPGGVSKLSYLQQEPLLISIGRSSNSVLMHIFDNPDHSARLLKSRKGHTAPPSCIQYLHPSSSIMAQNPDGTDAAACQILSGGSTDRTLRIFSTARSVLDKEYSQGKGLEKKARDLGLDSTADLLLPPISALTSSEARSRDWGDLVTIHRNHAMAYVWSTKRGAQSGPVLRQPSWKVSKMQIPPPRSCHATSLTLSACGNFAIIGTRGGTIYKYNVQSGLPRGSYPPLERNAKLRKIKTPGDIGRTMQALEKKMMVSNRVSDKDKEERDAVYEQQKEARRQAKLKVASHQDAAVTGLAVDSINKTLISVGEDAKLILWNFATHAPHKKSPYKLPSPASKMCHVRESDLAAIALKDYSVVLFDCTALEIVRRFGNGTQQHTGPISDLGFSPDGRTLFTSSLDGTIRVWDVPTNTCVDWMAFETPPTSLALSPTGEFLATSHTGRLGLSLWSDKSFYQTIHVDGAHPPTEPAHMDDPVPIAETFNVRDGQDVPIQPLAIDIDDDKTDDDKAIDKGPVHAKEEGLITMSGLPPAHWKNLFHLELVKERNKPTEAPKKPPSAPFFLQWRSGDTVDGKAGDGKLLQDTDKEEEQEWAAAWSDDNDEEPTATITDDKKRRLDKAVATKDVVTAQPDKRRKVKHYRSHLASLLEQGHAQSSFQAVTTHVATLGPSAIDVSLSTLCHGMHDLEEGLPLLNMAALWLLEACKSRERFEAVNAYLHRFLYLHSNVIAGIDDSIKHKKPNGDNEEQQGSTDKRTLKEQRQLLETVGKLRHAQQQAADNLGEKMQHTLCLLRHFSRMV